MSRRRAQTISVPLSACGARKTVAAAQASHQLAGAFVSQAIHDASSSPQRRRPPRGCYLPRAGQPSTVFTIRLSPAEMARAQAAARVNGQTPSDFVRDAIVSAAEDCLDPLP